MGPYLIHRIFDNRKLLELDTGDRLITASIDKVKKYLRDGASDRKEVEDPEKTVDGTENDLQELDKVLDSMWKDHEEDNSEVKADAIPLEEFLAKTIEQNDPRINDEDFVKAKRREVEGLKRKNVWRVVKCADVPKDANIIGGRFAYTLKNYQTPEEMAKARYVAQGYGDKDKGKIVHDTSTIRPSSIRIILSIAAILLLTLFSHDVTQTYLQSKDKLTRRVYIRVKKKDLETFGINEDELLELVKPLYGLCGAGDYWGITIEEHTINDLGMTPLVSDSSLYARHRGKELIGISGLQVDDCLNAGNKEFEELTKLTLRKFESKPRVYSNFDFFGTQIRKIAPGKLYVGQPYYTKNISIVPHDISFDEFRSHRSLFSWLTNTRPDAAFCANQAAQVTAQTFGREKINVLNRGITRIKRNPQRGLLYQKLDMDRLELRIYADASFACNDDLSSQIGFIILMCDSSNVSDILYYASKKCKRKVRSIMAAEVCAFMDAFDVGTVMARDLRSLLGKDIPINMFTDSKQLFDALTRGKQTTEKRLMIDIASAREAYKRFEIQAVGLVRGDQNPADGLTKENDNGALDALLESSLDGTDVELWIDRTQAKTHSN